MCRPMAMRTREGRHSLVSYTLRERVALQIFVQYSILLFVVAGELWTGITR